LKQGDIHETPFCPFRPVGNLALFIGSAPCWPMPKMPVSDEQLASNVKNALDADPELKALDLHVVSKKQEVTIDGKMTDDQQMYKAGVIAEKVPGVKFVINNMNM
jgi:hypothetical protein